MTKRIIAVIAAATGLAAFCAGCNGARTYGNETYHYHAGPGVVIDDHAPARRCAKAKPLYSKSVYRVHRYTVME
jgi:hypothetical protein